MELTEAARLLKHVHANAPEGKKLVYIHLFAIKYADEIRNLSCTRMVDLSGIPTASHVELWRALKLAEYVELKEDIDFNLETVQ
jgi:5-methylcytosine-specific restriction protein B